MKVKLIASSLHAEEIVAAAAKLCYSPIGIDELFEDLDANYEKKVVNFLDTLTSYGHESPIEHVNFTFAVEGVSRITEQQLTRHRLASYSIQSGRYVNRDNPEFIVPPGIANDSKALRIYETAMENSKIAYNTLVETLKENYVNEIIATLTFGLNGVNSDINNYDVKTQKKILSQAEKMALEDARYVYPQALGTKIIFTMNARTLLNFFKHRQCRRAQWEIRELANRMMELVKEECPTLFKYSGAQCQHGSCPEGTMTCGNPYPKLNLSK